MNAGSSVSQRSFSIALVVVIITVNVATPAMIFGSGSHAVQFPSWTPPEEGGIFRTWWFDPLVATTSFTVFIHLYWYEERKRGFSSNSTFTETIGVGWGPLYNSLGAYWLGIYLLQCFVPQSKHRPDGIPQNWMDIAYLLTEVLSGIVLYDALMFFLHWAMHEIPAYHHWHVRHHSNSKKVEARDTLRH